MNLPPNEKELYQKIYIKWEKYFDLTTHYNSRNWKIRYF